jgi:hypothetical protein
VGHSLELVQTCVAPAGHEGMHEVVVLPPPKPPGNPPPPPPASVFVVRQQTSPLEQFATLAHAVTVVVPAGH